MLSVYCGTKAEDPAGKKMGTAEQCLALGRVRRFGYKELVPEADVNAHLRNVDTSAKRKERRLKQRAREGKPIKERKKKKVKVNVDNKEEVFTIEQLRSIIKDKNSRISNVNISPKIAKEVKETAPELYKQVIRKIEDEYNEVSDRISNISVDSENIRKGMEDTETKELLQQLKNKQTNQPITFLEAMQDALDKNLIPDKKEIGKQAGASYLQTLKNRARELGYEVDAKNIKGVDKTKLQKMILEKLGYNFK